MADSKITKIRRTFYRHEDYPGQLFGSKKELDRMLQRHAEQDKLRKMLDKK